MMYLQPTVMLHAGIYKHWKQGSRNKNVRHQVHNFVRLSVVQGIVKRISRVHFLLFLVFLLVLVPGVLKAENQNESNQNETNEALNAEMHANKAIKNQNDDDKMMIR